MVPLLLVGLLKLLKPFGGLGACWGLGLEKGLGSVRGPWPWSRVPTRGPLARAAPWPGGARDAWPLAGPGPPLVGCRGAKKSLAGLVLGLKALGTGGPLARRPLGGPSRPSLGPRDPWPGALGPGALGPGGPWPGVPWPWGPLTQGCLEGPKITKLSNQPRQPPGPGMQLPGTRGPPARQTLNPKP